MHSGQETGKNMFRACTYIWIKHCFCVVGHGQSNE